MGDGSLDAFDRRQLVGDELGHFLHRLTDDHDHEVIGARDEVNGTRLGKAVDMLGDGVKADVPLRADVDLDERPDVLVARLIPESSESHS